VNELDGVKALVERNVGVALLPLATVRREVAERRLAAVPFENGAHTEPLAAVRCALYMATLSAVRHDRILKEFYLPLRAAGKKPLVAMTACMRKLVILMNRLLKNCDFQLAS
jgi:DNA-binding transcriptional LysR family regulator